MIVTKHDEQMTILALSWAIQDQDYPKAGRLALTVAQHEQRSHSLVQSQRTFQKLVSSNGIAAWGYAYENGLFVRS
jgi:membrane-bound inhibitor of C-type lysozyme